MQSIREAGMEEENQVVSEVPGTKVVVEADHKNDGIKVSFSSSTRYFRICLLYKVVSG